MSGRGLRRTALESLPGDKENATETAIETALSDVDFVRWHAELLDPESWGEILNTFGRTMKLAVALADDKGNLIGPIHNQQPVWSLARSGAHSGTSDAPPQQTSPVCLFCLLPPSPCSALEAALTTSQTIYTSDQSGLTHATIPLFLGHRRLGVLVAGQCFSQYPQPLALQRAAKHFGVAPQPLWECAIHQVPVSRATLRLYADLLAALGRAFLRQRYASILNRELLQTSERFRLMVEGSKDYAMLTVDGKGCVTSWNPGAANLFGYTEAEIVGEDYSALFTPEDLRSGIPKFNIQQAAESDWFEEEGWQLRKDGTRFLSESVIAKLGEGDATEYGFLLCDVTEARKAAESALQAQKLESIGILAGGIAHDFNNLLTGILGNLSLAMLDLPGDSPARPLLDLAERSSMKAAALVGQLLVYAGRSPAVVTQFDLSALISEIVPLVQTSVPKSVRLTLSLRPDLPWIVADSTEIQQIVMNLVINAAEAVGDAVGEEGGSVHVSTGLAGLSAGTGNSTDGVYIEVRDTGCGMDAATKRKIFDPFFTTKFTGRGLGLAAVSGIVQRLKGEMDVESVPGEGSTFRIVFPAARARVPVPVKAVAADPQGTGVILVVDDDPLIRDLVRGILERRGYTVLHAENGKTAVAMFRANTEIIKAVLLDLTMPVMGGKEAFYLMREIQSEIPIIISTGYGDIEARDNFGTLVSGIIQKPYTTAALVEQIAASIAHTKKPGAEVLRATGY